jgi:hypothetical protein
MILLLINTKIFQIMKIKILRLLVAMMLLSINQNKALTRQQQAIFFNFVIVGFSCIRLSYLIYHSDEKLLQLRREYFAFIGIAFNIRH